MRKQILTILDTQGRLWEEELPPSGNHTLVLGRDDSRCDFVIPDRIVSKIQGTFLLEEGRLSYRDENSRNGTFLGMGRDRRLLGKEDGFVPVFEKDILCIGHPGHAEEMVLLLYSSGEDRTVWQYRALTEKETYIGRNPSCEICLPHPLVSARHCRITRSEELFVLEDLHSTNGVAVNGAPAREAVVLNDKDVIQILGLQLLFSNGGIYYQAKGSGISLQVAGVSKTVGKGNGKKRILDQVSLDIGGNEFVAIIGGSGAGKTTLMNAISGFEPEFEGHVYCNGMDMKENFQMLKNSIGFVPQQDIIYENLTLERMLYYAAKIRMPDDTQKSERDKRIREVLDMVELGEQKDSCIRKLSGGQKKRASIAVELLADPSLFFLDEPTSGLDPGTEKNLMMNLKTLARTHGKTIIMVTHTTASLHLCDKIVFMGPGGRLCFCGSVEEAKAFFQTRELVDIYNKIAARPQFWQKEFRAYARSGQRPEEEKPVPEKSRKKSGPSAWRQFGVLCARYAELMTNDRPRLLVLLLQPCFIALLLWIVADKDIFDIYESTKSMLFALSCSGIWIGLFNSIQEICKERVIVKREYMANLKLPGYVLSKFVFQAVLGAVQSLLLTGIFLALVGKNPRGVFLDSFIPEMMLTVWLTVLASVALGLTVSAVVKTGDKGMTVAPFLLIIQLLFSGILFTLEGAGEAISCVTVSRWSVEALGSSARLNSLALRMQEEYPMLEHEAESFFRASRPHVLTDWGILAGMTAAFLLLAMVLLRGIAKDRR